MTNNQMAAGRFLRWYKARKMVDNIQWALGNGHRVVIATYTQATICSRKHIEMFKATRSGAYMQRGRKWVCIDHCAVRIHF